MKKQKIDWKNWVILGALCVYFALLESMPTPIALTSLALVCYFAFRKPKR